jgi:hypothetical protein
MQLASVTKAPSDDLRYMVREVNAIRLFYVTTGRTAWWSTWVTRYAEGCMHTTFASAREYCESRRVQGTVFYVTQLPALAFTAEGRVLAVTEINTQDILGRFDFAKLTDITTVLPVSTMTPRQISLLFRPQSPLWPRNFPRTDSAILAFGSPIDELTDLGTGDDLIAKASRAVGVDYSLEWSERPFTAKSSNVIALAATLSERVRVP